MSELKQHLGAEIKASLKGGEKVRLGALRLLSAAVVLREKELGRQLTDDELREAATREVKRRNEAIDIFEQAGRDELAAKERAEREALSPYLPEQLSEDQVDALIDEAIDSSGATSMKDMGRVMGAVLAGARGKVDGSTVQAKVRAKLGA